jgi:4-hydroxyphenylpyruvate dioxygenase-like putative hemolysin
LAGNPEGKKSLGIPSCRWECNIKMDLTEKRWKGVNFVHVAHDNDRWNAFLNVVTKFGFHKRCEIV